MTSAAPEPTALVATVEYPVSPDDLAAMRNEYAALEATTPEGYEKVRRAIGHLTTSRTSIEKRRVQLKAGALEYGRRVDAVAKQLTALVEAIEQPLREKKALIDDAVARAKRAAEEAARALAEAQAKAEREVEEKRIADQRAKLAAEQLAFEERRRKADEERDRVAAEQRAAQDRIDADRRALEEQQRAARDQQEARDQVERDRVAAEQSRAADVERVAAEQARLEALRPDIEKVAAFAAEVRALAARAPILTSTAATAIGWSVEQLEYVAQSLLTFGGQ